MTRPVFKSLHRQALVLGGERELVQFSALLAFIVGAGGQTLLSISCALAFWCVALFCLQRMAKSDPCLSAVFRRHVRQQTVYPARSTPWVRG